MFYYFLPRYKNANLEKNKFNACLEPAINWLKTFQNHANNLIITGDVGTGKTYLIHAFLHWLVENNNIPVKKSQRGVDYAEINGIEFTSAKEMIDLIRGTWKQDPYSIDTLNEIKKAKLLIIDEIGLQYGSDSERIEMHAIFDERNEWCLPTVAITNLTDKECESVLGKRNFSRLYGNATIVRVFGNDKRFE